MSNTYTASDVLEKTGLRRGQFSNLVANGVLSNIEPAGTGNRRRYSERNLGEIHISRALADVGFTIPEIAKTIRRVSAEEGRLVAKYPDGMFVLLIIDGSPTLDRVEEEMHKHVKWSRSLQVIKIGSES